MILKKQKTLIIILTLLMAILFTQCEKFDEIENIKKNETNIVVNKISFNEFSTRQKIQKTLGTVSNKFDINKRKLSNKNIISNDSSFIILTDKIFETIKDSITTYSFQIQTPTDVNSTFENFVITQSNDTLTYALYKYKYHKNYYSNYDYEISKQSINENQINTEDFSEYLNKLIVEEDGCVYRTVWVEYSAEDALYYGVSGYWTTPVLVTCGFDNSGGGSGDNGSQNNNDSNDNNNQNTNQHDLNSGSTNNNESDPTTPQNNGSGNQQTSPATTVNEPENTNISNAITEFFDGLSTENNDCLASQNRREIASFLYSNANPEITPDGDIIPANVLDFAEQAVQAICGGGSGNGNDNVDFIAMQNIIDLSNNSPFNLDTSGFFDNISPLPNDGTPEAEKFNCIFRKLTESPTFKSIFIDTFVDNPNLNITFVLANLPNNAGGGTVPNGINDVSHQTIKINRNHLNTKHPLTVAQTIIHETLHAFLNYKQANCDSSNSGPSIYELGNMSLGNLLNNFSYNCIENASNDHNLMFNLLLPIIQQQLSEVLDELVASENINPDHNFYPPPTGEQHVFSWDKALYYMSLNGLHEANSYTTTTSDTPNESTANSLFIEYNQFINNEDSSNYFNHSVNCN